MLKRNGELCKYTVPGFVGKLTRAEFDAYNEAFDVIKDEFAALERIKNDLKEITANPGISTIPSVQNSKLLVAAKEGEGNNGYWDVRSRLLLLRHSEVFLCERSTNEGKEFAVIEHYRPDSEYARANGNAAVLLTGNDPALVVQDYAESAQHTLRFMASNMVGMAQTVVWERYASQSPSRVIRAISERCASAVGDAQNEIQMQILEKRMARQQSMGQRQSMGQGV
jgi:hypothetical protein